MPDQNKLDALDRKGAWVERMFDRVFKAAREDTKATIIVVLLGWIIWQQITINEANRLRIADITALNEKINLATEKSVERKLNEKLAPIQAKQDSTSKAVDTTLLNLNGTVESVRKYINKKK